MTREELRDTLQRLELSQGALARILKHLGDPATPHTILRRVEGWCQGRTRVPGEAAALLAILVRFPGVLRSLQRDLRAIQGDAAVARARALRAADSGSAP